MHNLRSALDHLTWQLAGGKASDTSTMFLISDNPNRYAKEAKRRLKNVSMEACKLIETLQPYHSPEPNHTEPWAINALDNADKHRLLLVTAGTGDELHLVFDPSVGREILSQVGGPFVIANAPLVKGGPVATFTLPDIDVAVTARLIPHLEFHSDLWPSHEHVSVLRSLNRMADWVERVIAQELMSDLVEIAGDAHSEG